jgi:hypothetical protein
MRYARLFLMSSDPLEFCLGESGVPIAPSVVDAVILPTRMIPHCDVVGHRELRRMSGVGLDIPRGTSSLVRSCGARMIVL